MARAIDGARPLHRRRRGVATRTRRRPFSRTHRVDVILLDIEMPGIDGLTALPDLIAASRGARVLIVSSACDDGAATTVQALALGAADTLVKPEVGAFAGRFADLLNEKIDRGWSRPIDGRRAAHARRGGRAAATISTSSRSAPRPAGFTRSASCCARSRPISGCRS